MAAAKIPPDRAAWFVTMVTAAVWGWLSTADHPPMRDVVPELVELARRLYDALSAGCTPEACAPAAAAYARLSPAALQASPDIDRPAGARIGEGEPAALHQLFGLIPVSPAPRGSRDHPFGRGARYRGRGAREAHQRGRPRDVRLEQLLCWLLAIYKTAAGREGGRGADSPFEDFFRLLLSYVIEEDVSDRGDHARRRSISARKSLKEKVNAAPEFCPSLSLLPEPPWQPLS
ncbi:MAG: hypothetical protein ACJ8H8_07920 [Geminicoccaceae bacterium]